MQRAFTQIKQQHASIHGVIHSAIVLADKTIAKMDEAMFLAAFNPKVIGSINLYEVFQSEPLDFMLFFSSLQSFLGAPGQSNYAAGSCFKDTLAQALNQQQAYPVKLINWGYWGSVGIVSSQVYQEVMASQGIQSIAPKEGMAAIERLLFSSAQQLIYAKLHTGALNEIGINANQTVSRMTIDEQTDSPLRLTHRPVTVSFPGTSKDG